MLIKWSKKFPPCKGGVSENPDASHPLEKLKFGELLSMHRGQGNKTLIGKVEMRVRVFGAEVTRQRGREKTGNLMNKA